jgi:hypothetical protein
MHAVVNHMPIKEGTNWAEIAERINGFAATITSQYPKVHSTLVVKVSDSEAIFIALFDDKETMETFSSKVAGPWFAENIRPYLAGPVSRSVGEVVAGAGL